MSFGQCDHHHVGSQPFGIGARQAIRLGHFELIRTDDHGHLVHPQLISVLVARTLTQTLWIYTRLEELPIEQDLVMTAFVEEDRGVLFAPEMAESREYPVRTPLAGHFQGFGNAEDADGLAGFALPTGSNECQYRRPRPYSVVLWCKLGKPAVDQRVRFERVLPEAERFLGSVDLVLEVQHLLLLPKVLESRKRQRCSRIAAPNQISDALIVGHLGTPPLLPNYGLGHREILHERNDVRFNKQRKKAAVALT